MFTLCSLHFTGGCMVQEFAENVRSMTDERFDEFMFWVIRELEQMSETSLTKAPVDPEEAV